MEKSVTWKENGDISESSPSLSESKRETPKRKRSNIFTRLRKSILGNSETDNSAVTDENVNLGLKRALSMDAGLQKRISQLASNVEKPIDSENHHTQIPGTPLRRSRSLLASPRNIDATSAFASSQLSSPKSENTDDFNDTDSVKYAKSFISAEFSTSCATANTQIFNCSWLAPTRRGQLFLGQLILRPKSEIQFHYQHAARTIKLKFRLQDILNIAKGAWNNQRDQALIIDLMQGKRKTWVFVAWTDDQFHGAVDSIVRAWRCHTMSHIKERIDRKNAMLNMKYCNMIKESSSSKPSGMHVLFLPKDFVNLKNLYDAFKGLFNFCSSKSIEESLALVPTDSTFPLPSSKSFTLKSILVEECFDGIIPDILAAILTERSTNFMTNFRELQKIAVINDSGWPDENDGSFFNLNSIRSFTSIMTNNGTRKWRINQRYIVNKSEFTLIEAILTGLGRGKQVFKLLYEIERSSLTQFTCKLKISGRLESGGERQLEEDISKYLKKEYFEPMMELLAAYIRESRNEFEYDSSSHHYESSEEEQINPQAVLLPPHYRFLKEELRIAVMKLDLYFTTLILPLLYMLVHNARIQRIAVVSIVLFIIYFLAASFRPLQAAERDIQHEFIDLIGGIVNRDREVIQIRLAL
jgi:hypothetical protein